jgi:hypothetical protein
VSALTEVHRRVAERVLRQLEEVGERLEELEGPERAFGVPTATERAALEAEKREVAALEERARAEPPPGPRKNPGWTRWKWWRR